MGLTDSQKKHYAWEFLRRSPEYREFWDSHQAALASIRPKSKLARRQRKQFTLENNKILRDDARRAMGRWCISKIHDPSHSLDKASIDALFKLLKPVTPFFDAPWAGDSRLYIAIDPYGSLAAINKAIRNELKLHKARLNVPQRARKMPRAEDLRYYLAILDCYQKFLTGTSPENRNLPKYGYSKGWAKLEKALQAKGFHDADQIQLMDGTLEHALSLRDSSPFAFLA